MSDEVSWHRHVHRLDMVTSEGILKIWTCTTHQSCEYVSFVDVETRAYFTHVATVSPRLKCLHTKPASAIVLRVVFVRSAEIALRQTNTWRPSITSLVVRDTVKARLEHALRAFHIKRLITREAPGARPMAFVRSCQPHNRDHGVEVEILRRERGKQVAFQALGPRCLCVRCAREKLAIMTKLGIPEGCSLLKHSLGLELIGRVLTSRASNMLW